MTTASATVSFTVNGVAVAVRAPTTPTCSPRCARSSTSPRPRTAARRRASAAAAPCSSTARPSSRASSRWPRSTGRSVTTLEGVDRRRAGPLRRRVRRLRRPAVRLLHPRHRRAGQGPDRQEGRRPHPRGHGPPPRRPPVPLHRLREDPRRHRGCRRRQGAGARAARRHRHQRRQVRGGELALGDRGYVDDLRVPGHAARRPPPHRPRPRRHPAHRRRRGARARRASSAVLHRGRRPRRAAGRHHPHGLAGADPRGRAHLVRRRRPRHRRGRDPAAGARRGRRWSTSTTRCCGRSPMPSPPSTTPRSRCGAPTRTCCRCPSTAGATSRPRWPPAPTSCTRSSRPSASSTRSSSPRPRWPSPTRGRRRRCTCTPAARACGTTATRSRPSSASSTSRITVELVSNGGAFGGKEDMANQAQAALAAWLLQRPVKCVLSREESLRHAPQAPPDRDGVLGRVRRRRPPDRRARPHGRRLRRLRLASA